MSAVGTLFVVSTPIGNLGDFSLRAIETLRGVTAVLAEDTRHSRPLLERFEIQTSLLAYHEHNEASATPRLVERMQTGESFALISDAGTPLLSDPGARLVSAAVAAGVAVVPIPGASALLAALVGAGVPSDRFTFYGFLARKGRERTEAIAEIVQSRYTAVVYEAPSRVGATLRDFADAGATERTAVVARELTKQFEEFRRGTIASLALSYQDEAPRGEVVLVIEGGTPTVLDETQLRERARSLRAEGVSARDVVRVLMEESAAPRNLAYRLAHE